MKSPMLTGNVGEQAGRLAVELSGIILCNHGEGTHVKLADGPTLLHNVLHQCVFPTQCPGWVLKTVAHLVGVLP